MDLDQPSTLDPVPAPITAEIQWPAPRHYLLAKRALENESAALNKLADKNDDAGYNTEARRIRDDAKVITLDMLPTLEAQGEIPLATEDEVKHAIMNEFRGTVRFHAKEASETVDHEAVLLDRIGEKVAKFATALAAEAYAAGRIVREHEPEIFALRAVKAISELTDA